MNRVVVASAVVLVGAAGLRIILDSNREATTDSAGRFQYLDVPAGWHSIDVLRSGSERVHEIEKTVDGSGLAIAIQLHPQPERSVHFCTLERRPNVGVVVHPARLPQTSTLGIPRGIAIRVVDGDYDDTIYGDSPVKPMGSSCVVGRRARRPAITPSKFRAWFRLWRRTGVHVARETAHHAAKRRRHTGADDDEARMIAGGGRRVKLQLKSKAGSLYKNADKLEHQNAGTALHLFAATAPTRRSIGGSASLTKHCHVAVKLTAPLSLLAIGSRHSRGAVAVARLQA
jgi:hypothetical protein